MPASQEASCSTKPRGNAAFRSAAAPAAVAGRLVPACEGKDALATPGETPALQTAAFGKNALVYASPPPSTTSAAPVIQLDIGLTRNKTAFATSSGVPMRASGRFAASRINAFTSSPS